MGAVMEVVLGLDGLGEGGKNMAYLEVDVDDLGVALL